MARKSHYDTLGVSPTSTTAEIRRAYHRLARDHHPDRFTDPTEKQRAEQRFTEMSEAFNTLSDASRRREYDAVLAKPDTGETSAQKEAKSYHRAGVAKQSEGAHPEAVRLFKAAFHLDPKIEYHVHLAQALQAANELSEAARVWDEVVKREPANSRYLSLAGACFEQAGMNIRARRMYESALRLDKGDKRAIEAIERLSEDPKKTGILGGLFKRS